MYLKMEAKEWYQVNVKHVMKDYMILNITDAIIPWVILKKYFIASSPIGDVVHATKDMLQVN